MGRTLLAIFAAVSLMFGLVAAATPVLGGHSDAPGNNGTIKVHDNNPGEPDPDVRNQPHVCQFDLHFFFADAGQTGEWWIKAWPPTSADGPSSDPEGAVLAGTYLTDADGEYRDPEAGYHTLPDGHYKLFWEGATNPGGQTNIKHKVFWVDCPEEVGEEMGDISIVKEADDDATASFGFEATWDADGFSLMDGQSETSGDLAAGDYTVTETLTQAQVEAGWSLADIDCGDATAVVDLAAGSVTISLAAGESVTCTFTNELEAVGEELGSVLVAKVDDEDASLGGATFEIDGVGVTDSDLDGFVCVDGLELGAEITIVETAAPEGYIGDDEPQTVTVTSTLECEERLDGATTADADAVFVNLEEGELIDEEGILEIDKILCPGEGDPLFEVITTGALPTQFGIQSMHDECTTMDATFIVTPVGAGEAWGEVTTDGGTVTFELPAGDYVLTEKETGAMSGTVTVVEGALTIVLVTNFEGEGEQPAETANLKVVKWFCEGEEADVLFQVLGGDVAIPNPADCELGNATFALNDPESETTYTTSGGVLWLTGLPLGTHTLYEVAPNEASVEFTLSTDGGWVTIFAFNVAGEGEQPAEETPGEGEQPTQGGPGEGTLGGQLPDTAMPVTGSVPAALLAIAMLVSLGATGYVMQAQARRRR